ncbi:unnamed protein product [Victoria cruziana]
MLPRRRPPTLRACSVFARRSLPVVPSSPLALWVVPPLLRYVRLWITGTSVVEWDSRRVTRSTVPRCEVQVDLPTLVKTRVGPPFIRPEVWITRPPSQPSPFRPVWKGIASGIGADSASAASCRTGVIQYAVPHVPPLLCSFPIPIVKHHEQQDVEKKKWLVPCIMPAACHLLLSCTLPTLHNMGGLFAFGKDGEDLLADPSIPMEPKAGSSIGRIRLQNLRQSRSVRSNWHPRTCAVRAGLLFHLSGSRVRRKEGQPTVLNARRVWKQAGRNGSCAANETLWV